MSLLVSSYGVRLVPIQRVGRWSHAAAGATIFLCGIGVFLERRT